MQPGVVIIIISLFFFSSCCTFQVIIILNSFVFVLVQAVGESHLSGMLVIVEHIRVIMLWLEHVKIARDVGCSGTGHGRLRELVGHNGGNRGPRGLRAASVAIATSRLPGGNCASLPTAFDTLVAVLIVLLEVSKEVAVFVRDATHLDELDKHASEVLKRFLVEVVLVSFHVAQLREGLVAIIKSANERLETLVGFFVGADIPSLGKGLAANTARVWFFASVATHVRLEVSTLGKGEAAVVFGAHLDRPVG